MPRLIKCCVLDCWRKSSDPEKLTFHRFPCDVDLCRIWLQKAGNKELTWLPESFLTKSRYVCSAHFPPSSYRPGTNLLKSGSIPSIFEANIVPLTEEDVMIYPLKGRSAVKHKKKDRASFHTDHDKDKNEEVSNITQEGNRTLEVVCNSPTFMEYLNTGKDGSGQEDLSEVMDSAGIAAERRLCDMEGDSEVGSKMERLDGRQEEVTSPKPLHYSFTITENLDIRLNVQEKSVEPEPLQDLEFWKDRAERLQKENEILTSKVASMQVVINGLQKELESRKSVNSLSLGMSSNQCYFIDLSSATAGPISL